MANYSELLRRQSSITHGRIDHELIDVRKAAWPIS